MEEDWQRDLQRWLEPYLEDLGSRTHRLPVIWWFSRTGAAKKSRSPRSASPRIQRGADAMGRLPLGPPGILRSAVDDIGHRDGMRRKNSMARLRSTVSAQMRRAMDRSKA
jgi:hypothetical protein